MRNRLFGGLSVLALVLSLGWPGVARTGATGSSPSPADDETWRGAIDLSSAGAGELEFFVTFSWDQSGQVAATISIPAQNARGIPLADVVHRDSRLEFTLVTQPASGVFTADRSGDEATGTLRQGAEFPISMRRAEAGVDAGPDRPQTPQPPFPYQAREVRYVNEADGTVLAGTLTVPNGPGPQPAAILITGSGAQDRDETIFDHKPFWVIADHLSRRGIAVLRVDDRGVGGSSGSIAASTSQDFAGDVLAGMAWLSRQPEVDPSRLGLIGHSEGGLIAPMAAAEGDGVAFIVLLAGTGLSGREVMPTQLADVQRSVGRPEDNIERQLQAQARLMDASIAGDEAAIRAAATELVDVQFETVPEDQRTGPARDRTIERAVRQMSTAWYRAFLANDPRDWLRRVTCPVLALNGTLDLQVDPKLNLEAIGAALREAGNGDVTLRPMEGLNHLFQHARTGAISEYGTLTETIAPEVLDTMTSWIRERVGLE